MIIANIHKAKTDLSKLVAYVLSGGEVIISNNNKPKVKLVRYTEPKQKSSFGMFKGKVWMSDDFNDEDPEINKMFGVE